MPAVTFITPDGRAIVVEVALGQSLMYAALTHGVDGILGECGGCLSCGTCHVYLDAKSARNVPAMGEEESDLLDFASDRRPGSRLCCQIIMTEELDGMVLMLPETQP